MCSYFDAIIKIEDFDHDILIDEKPFENIFVYNIWYKRFIDSKSLRISFDKIDAFIRVYDGTTYLVLLGNKKYDSIYNRIRYLTGATSAITYIISHNYATIKVDSCDCLPLEKTMTLCNVILFVKSVWNKEKNNYYYVFRKSFL